jgi:hypothetical protein
MLSEENNQSAWSVGGEWDGERTLELAAIAGAHVGPTLPIVVTPASQQARHFSIIDRGDSVPDKCGTQSPKWRARHRKPLRISEEIQPWDSCISAVSIVINLNSSVEI